MTNLELYEKAVRVIRSVYDPKQVPIMVRYFNRAKHKIGFTSLYRDMIEVVFEEKYEQMTLLERGEV